MKETSPSRRKGTAGTVPVPQIVLADIEAARSRIGSVLPPTPLAASQYFSSAWGCTIRFKFENLQVTGSFKERGALNKLLCLRPEERARGVITASAGNHGQAVAYHAKRLHIPATICMPVNCPLVKVQNTRSYGANAVLHGATFDDAAEHARKLCAEQGLIYVHGFDDPHVIAGQGTLGLELLDEWPELDCIVVPVGGGGLISGIAVAVKSIKPEVRIIGVQFEGVQSMMAALKGGAPVLVPPAHTIADGIAVRQVGQMDYVLARDYVDEIVCVSETEIAHAILLMLERERTMLEGAGAVGVAALQNGRISPLGKNVVVVLSGGNIDVNVLSRIIEKGLVKDGRRVKLRVVVPDSPGHLSRILDSVAAASANVLEVSHTRAFSDLQVGETGIDLILETRGEEHIMELQDKLLEEGIYSKREW